MLVQPRVQPFRTVKELVVCADLDDPAVVDDGDTVRARVTSHSERNYC